MNKLQTTVMPTLDAPLDDKQHKLDPALMAAFAEIAQIVERYDLAASVCLVSEGYGKHALRCSASWNCIIEDCTEGGLARIRIKSTRADTPDEQERQRLLVNAASTISALLNLNMQHNDILKMLFDKLEEDYELESIIERVGR